MSTPGPLLQYRCPPLMAWLSESACTRLHERATKRVTMRDRIAGKADPGRHRLPWASGPWPSGARPRSRGA